MMLLRAPDWIDALPNLRGRLTQNAPLGKITWLQVGGPAELMFRPVDEADLQLCLDTLWPEIPITVLGVSSNVLIRDGGIPGLVIRLGRGFTTIIANADHSVIAGAAALDLNVAMAAAEAGIAGLEFYAGIPGTIGGAIRMNAGAFGGETGYVLDHAVIIRRDGMRREDTPADLGLRYRHSDIGSDDIVIAGHFTGQPDAPDAIMQRIERIRHERETNQPLRVATGGSTFKNPQIEDNRLKAWELIDAAGCRGLRQGGAMVSEKHCNFLINCGGASAADLENLGEEIRRRVYDTSGILLEWEIERIGVAA